MELNDLPDEVLLQIFSLLPPLQLDASVARVCRRWRELVGARVLVLRGPSQLERLPAGLAALVAVRRVPGLCAASALLSRASACARLTHLALHCELPLDEKDYTILATFEHLQHLDVFCKKRVLNKDTLLPPSVTTLVVNDNMANGFLPTLCPQSKVEGFHMYGRSLYYSPREMVKFIGAHSTHLTELTLRCTEMTDKRYAVLGECGALRALRLYSCWLLTWRGVLHLARPRLRCLHLTGARMVRSRALATLLAALPAELQELNVSCGWLGAEHEAAAARLAGLRALEAWRCRADGAALLRLALRLPRLRRLDTDARLSPAQLADLLAHPALQDVRCGGAAGGRGTGRVRVRAAGAGTACVRGDGDGPSADVFYRWADP
ncbi:F-box/LRR-repeat protein 7-like [Aricia agestis]|uniref:F-box/LRR-repeat protein 7-like n=1 Tax=Aricia agestis TaxID=91739 RepID=UPI001C206932|nr:F-box/LRR-repeat protein 7-like [Aricia agestis]